MVNMVEQLYSICFSPSHFKVNIWWVVWNMFFLFFHILGIIYSHLTFIFFRGVAKNHQPESTYIISIHNCWWVQSWSPLSDFSWSWTFIRFWSIPKLPEGIYLHCHLLPSLLFVIIPIIVRVGCRFSSPAKARFNYCISLTDVNPHNPYLFIQNRQIIASNFVNE